MINTEKHIGSCSNKYLDAMYRVPISFERAKENIKFICGRYNIDEPEIIFTGRNTKKLCGTYNTCTKIIKIHKCGETYGTVLHELAHHVVISIFGVSVKHHGNIFKMSQNQIINAIINDVLNNPNSINAPRAS